MHEATTAQIVSVFPPAAGDATTPEGWLIITVCQSQASKTLQQTRVPLLAQRPLSAILSDLQFRSGGEI